MIKQQHSAGGRGWTAGIDVGGTKTLLCLTGPDGGIISKRKLDTLLGGEPGGFMSWLFAQLAQLCRDHGTELAGLAGVGIGLPGVVDESSGILSCAPALGWPEEDIRPWIRREYEGIVVLDNDVNMAALGEQAAGAAAGREHFAMLTVGTGIGGALYLNGQLYRGAAFAAGEFGYLLLEPDDLPSGEPGAAAQQFGALESKASGTGIALEAARCQADGPLCAVLSGLAAGGPVTAQHVFAAAAQGSGLCARVLDRAFVLMAMAVANLAVTLNPQLVVLGGGVVDKNAEYAAELARRVRALSPVAVDIRRAELGNEAGAVGAAAAARRALFISFF
ncbi:ROK family protein [Paenibacillus sp. MMS20-IR301]|uniref:ROK family protein n=1 Tax=Paenibacillus sp. MMS20-IR301 TaxID=2895946 RepID=UPI0028F00241|nr:ROK family protein [Paenibacillus sp. MMS20-IR301]WNS43761.1 ROK family protein [Paenibacillus sp. MMS20-IR301]